ncbi:MAG: 4-hydroxythreonine-4-phosphate dehydrogenase PdxA [Acidobacteriota bacterium]|nr:4-hydroxythreonine-4-phosphate dehydrogenase PdxA [Acidobacteriota bacterium]
MSLPLIGVTLGDPGGIGPEIAVKALLRWPELPPAHFVLFGTTELLRREERSLGVSLGAAAFESGAGDSGPRFSLVEVPVEPLPDRRGEASAANGRASFAFFLAALEAAQSGRIQAFVTAPISKLSWSLGGIPYHGHTEYLETIYPETIMSFWSEKLVVALFSHHLPLRDALRRLDKDALVRFIGTLRHGVEKAKPGLHHYLVAGLNPHAGENGLMGREEIEIIAPAVEAARAAGADVSGPFPPDVVFRMAYGRPRRIVIALYHDQGLIPFKLEAFDTGVNATLGLPFLRTSPDHGTAFDIAGKNLANPQSMAEAVRLAVELSPAVL